MEFLICNMPDRDLRSLSADYLLQNTRLAYLAWQTEPFEKQVPTNIFLNNVLPYASINERRDNWRADFRKRFLPIVKDAKSITEAATLLNGNVFKQVGVRYSTARVKADQSPFESIQGGTASCTGLSVLLIDACRAVGIPARFAGTPLWANKSGNHSWVEIWDNGWHFTGAAEPTDNKLDQGWFIANATSASRDNPIHAIYATSFKKTPLNFPCVWDENIQYISAVNVTDRYVAIRKTLPDGMVEIMFVVHDGDEQRIATQLRITHLNEVVFNGITNDERFDANDHLRVPLEKQQKYVVEIGEGKSLIRKTIETDAKTTLISFTVPNTTQAASAQQNSTNNASRNVLKTLQQYLQTDPSERAKLEKQDFAVQPLTKSDAGAARKMLAEDRMNQIRKDRAAEMKSRVLTDGEFRMPFDYTVYGEKPKNGRSLYISLHGGGGAPAAVNDQQWENQKHLYQLDEGIYVAPRAPTNTWNMWHQDHIDRLLSRLIENMVAFEDVDWNRVYLLGYSAGGDGVYQLAPRMSDRWAAASMMAGHPNETSPLGLRNLPFALQVGGKDAAYRRNEIAGEWKVKLAELQKADPNGYQHFVEIYPDKGHWMDRQDAVAIPWMASHTRNPLPPTVVWKQDDVTHPQLYWIGVDAENQKPGSLISAEAIGQTIQIKATEANQVIVYLDDRFVDLDSKIKIMHGDQSLFEGIVQRTIAALSSTLDVSGDPNLSFPSSVSVSIPKEFPDSLVPSVDIPRHTATRTSMPLKVDGRLDESEWVSAKKTTSFVDLITGKETVHSTRAAVLWDDKYLYIGFWVDEPNVDAKYENRDDPIYYDNDVEVFIAGKDAYYEFEVNALNTVYEGFFVWQTAYDRDAYNTNPQLERDTPKTQVFDGVGFTGHPRGKRLAFLGYDFPNFKSAVHVEGTLNDDSDVDKGWTVELAFPWQEMQALAKGDNRALPPNPGDQWRIDLFRFNKYKSSETHEDSGGWALGKHGVWDSHIPEVFPIITFDQ